MLIRNLTIADLASAPTYASLSDLPPGEAGTRETLRLMRDAARTAVRSENQQVRELALSLTEDLPERDWAAQVRALHAFVRDNIRFTRDPYGVELVQTPEKTLEYRQGDCDDKSTLLAALLDSIGHPARFVAVGLAGEPFSHVLVETKIDANWVPLETILNVPMGWYPRNVTTAYRLNV